MEIVGSVLLLIGMSVCCYFIYDDWKKQKKHREYVEGLFFANLDVISESLQKISDKITNQENTMKELDKLHLLKNNEKTSM